MYVEWLTCSPSARLCKTSPIKHIIITLSDYALTELHNMKVLIYNELNPKSIPGFTKLQKYLEDDDFKSADVKKVGDNLYRARLNQRDRLLFSIYRHQGQSYALMLEFIKNHVY